MTEKIDPASGHDPDAVHRHRRMEYVSFIAQVVSTAALIVSLMFVAFQISEGTKIASREESNASMSQWSKFRSSIYESRETAEVFRSGLDDTRELDPTDQMRFDYMMREHAWATFQLWDRAEEGLVPARHFDAGAGPDFLRIICTPGGSKTWARIRSELPEAYVQDLEALADPSANTGGASCQPMLTATGSPEATETR